jgi:hypothetical protein
MELKALLHKLQVLGRKVADGAREPGEILKFEQLQRELRLPFWGRLRILMGT